MLLLDHYRFKDAKMSAQKYLLVPICNKVLCTKVSPNTGKRKDFIHGLGNAKQTPIA